MANPFSYFFGDDEEELEAPIPIPVKRFDPLRQIPASSAYDVFIEGPSLRTGGDDVLLPLSPLMNFVPPTIEPEDPMMPQELEEFREKRAAYQGPRQVPDADSGAYPEIPLFRQVADHTAMFAAHIDRLDPEKSRKITELQMIGEQSSTLDRSTNPGIMLRQSQGYDDPTTYDPETRRFDKMPTDVPRTGEPVRADLITAINQEPAIEDASTPEGQAELLRRLGEMGLHERFKPRDEGAGAFGSMQLEATPIKESLDYMRRNPDDSAVLRAFFMDRGLDMEDLQTDAGQNKLTDEIAYNLETSPDPAFQGAVNAMYLLYKRNLLPQVDLNTNNTEDLIDYLVTLQAPDPGEITEEYPEGKRLYDYKERLRAYLTR